MSTMKTIKYQIQFHSYWHCGSGLASGADSDALVIKDRNSMPYIPGKTLKGLIKEAANFLISLKSEESDELQKLFRSVFGSINDDGSTSPGNAFFSNATIEDTEYIQIVSKALTRQMYSKVSSTAIDENGIASPHSLRSMEVTIPCTLYATIKYDEQTTGDFERILTNSIQLIKRIGVGRNRGMGRCTCACCKTIDSNASATTCNDTANNNANKRKYKCTLLSDIILNDKSATEGNVSTLDFIPGSNFLGIVARHYTEMKENAFTIFHSGKIRFSDAHAGAKGIRSLHVPASLYLPKLQTEPYYIHHRSNHSNSDISALQLKQERKGFYLFGKNEPTPQIINTQSTFAIKSAYDAETRHSKDGQMFGYASLNKGLEMYFEVDADDDSKELLDIINQKLIGEKHIGKSRSAQYGLVNIEPYEYTETESSGKTFTSSSGNNGEQTYATVYADSRLIFLDQYGVPTFTPTAQDLGFKENAIIAWEHSQVRIFDYAPWNGKRQCFDTNRCGIEKGSVFVVMLNGTESPDNSRYIGYYKNEGFGKVIYNPYFLAADEEGKATITLHKKGSDNNNMANTEDTQLGNLPNLLLKMKGQEEIGSRIYQIVREWCTKNAAAFTNEQFSAQWGAIRNIAIANKDYQTLCIRINEFLNHGVAKDKWDKKSRKKIFSDFYTNEQYCKNKIDDSKIYQAVINLASEMQKKYSTK